MGLDYFGARYYNSEVVRWMSVDPKVGKYPSFSPYNYTANNPVLLFDPNGEFAVSSNGASVTRVSVNTAKALSVGSMLPLGGIVNLVYRDFTMTNLIRLPQVTGLVLLLVRF